MGAAIPTEQVIAALEGSHGLVSLAARNLHCSDATIRGHMRRNKAVAAVVEQQRERLVDEAESALWACVKERQPWAVAMVLRTLGKRRGYGDNPASDLPDGLRMRELVIREIVIERPLPSSVELLVDGEASA